MMKDKSTVRECFLRHSVGADLCVIEGVAGLYDSRDGISEDGSTAQIAKWIGDAPIVFVVDASKTVRSVPAWVLGFQEFDKDVRIGAVITNFVNSESHRKWIEDALAQESHRLVDSKTKESVLFAGAFPKEVSVGIGERHLGLKIPGESGDNDENTIFDRLAILAEKHLNLDALLKLAGKFSSLTFSQLKDSLSSSLLKSIKEKKKKCCRIGVAYDEAFNFYYSDNLILLEQHGAELVEFSPIHSKHLPSNLDALYLGGGFSELHAEALHNNASLRQQIHDFGVLSEKVIYAECGGMMYLTRLMYTRNADNKDTLVQFPRKMVNIFSEYSCRMTPNVQMYYTEISFPNDIPLFPGLHCCGQRFHLSEIFRNDSNKIDCHISPSSVYATPKLYNSEPEPDGLVHQTWQATGSTPPC